MTPEINNILFVAIVVIISLNNYLWVINWGFQSIWRSVFRKFNHTSFILPPIELHTNENTDVLFLQKIHYLLDRNIDDPQFDISQLCKFMGMSRAQIYRKFNALYGRTLHDYMRYCKLNKAKEILLTTKLNVSEVAYGTGFTNISHFSRIFNEEFGKNPRGCRKELILFA